jgi:hypothetical protein
MTQSFQNDERSFQVAIPTKQREEEEKKEEVLDLIEPSLEFKGGYRDVLDRYYTCYTGPHQEAIYQHSNG